MSAQNGLHTSSDSFSYLSIAIGDQNATNVILIVNMITIICIAAAYIPVSEKSLNILIDHLSILDKSHSIRSIGINGTEYLSSSFHEMSFSLAFNREIFSL